MAKVFCSKDMLVVTAKTSIFIFRYTLFETNFNVILEKTINVDFEANVVKDVEESSSKNTNKVDTDVPLKAVSQRDQPAAEPVKQILGGCFSVDGLFFAVITSMKTCIVYVTQKWELRCPPFHLSKAPTSVIFDFGSKYVLIADRAGNVTRYRIQTEDSGSNNGEEVRESKGELLLGHVSMILAITISYCGKYICSADRDEKLRISRYPQSFVIHRFCLGHESYVNCVAVVKNFIFSSGGDGSIRVWDIVDGHLITFCDFFEKQQIRVFRTVSTHPDDLKIAVLLEESKAIETIEFNICEKKFERFSTLTSINNIVDMEFVAEGKALVAVSREAVLFALVNNGGQLAVLNRISAEVLEALNNTRDVAISLKKSIGFNNVQEYRRRKAERILKKRKKLEHF